MTRKQVIKTILDLKKSVDENNVEDNRLGTDYGININEDIDSVDFYENRIEELKG